MMKMSQVCKSQLIFMDMIQGLHPCIRSFAGKQQNRSWEQLVEEDRKIYRKGVR